jgi:hypothetical protein
MAAGDAVLDVAYTEIGRQTEVGETARLHAAVAYSLPCLDRPAEALVALDVFVARRPLTKGPVLSAIGDTDVPGDVRNPAGRSQLRFADLRPTKRPGRSTDNPEVPRNR